MLNKYLIPVKGRKWEREAGRYVVGGLRVVWFGCLGELQKFLEK